MFAFIKTVLSLIGFGCLVLLIAGVSYSQSNNKFLEGNIAASIPSYMPNKTVDTKNYKLTGKFVIQEEGRDILMVYTYCIDGKYYKIFVGRDTFQVLNDGGQCSTS